MLGDVLDRGGGNCGDVLGALYRIRGDIDRADPARYESLPMNDSMLLHTIVSNALIVPGTGVAPFKGDIGIGASRAIRVPDPCRCVSLTASP